MDLDPQDIKFLLNGDKLFDEIKTLREEIKSAQKAIAALRRDTIKRRKIS